MVKRKHKSCKKINFQHFLLFFPRRTRGAPPVQARQRLHMASDAYCAALSRALYIWCLDLHIYIYYIVLFFDQPKRKSGVNQEEYQMSFFASGIK